MEASALTHASRYRLLGRRSPLLRLQGDDRLVALIRAHHDRAFEVLFDRYQPRLLAFCRGMLGSAEDAEDVLQDVFVAAHAAMLADSRPINVRPWLYRIARNRCLNHLRRPVAEGTESMDAHPDNNGSTVDHVQRREELRAIFADVAELPETQRTALVLREIDDLSYEEIAEAMGTTLAAVKSLLVRARMSLAEASEARVLDCGDVRLELAEAAEGLRKLDGPTRQHVRKCERCGRYRSELRSSTRALAGLAPVFSLWMLKKLVAAKIFGSGSGAAGGSAGAGGGAGAGAGAGAAGTAGAGATAGVGATATAAAGVGTSGVAAAGTTAGGLAGSGIAAGGGIAGGAVGAVGAKAATVATAALITAGAVGVQHYASPSPTKSPPAPVKAAPAARPPATTYNHASGGATATHPKPSHPAPKPKPAATTAPTPPAATTPPPTADTSTVPATTTPTTDPATTTPSDQAPAAPTNSGGATGTAVEGQGGTSDPTATGDSVPVEPTYSNGGKPPKPPKPAPVPTPIPTPPTDPVPVPEPPATPPDDPAPPTDPPAVDPSGTTTTTTP